MPGRAHLEAFPGISGMGFPAEFTCFLARDAFIRTHHRTISMMFVRLSVCDGCDHTAYFSADLSLWLDGQCAGHTDTKAYLPNSSRLFSVPPRKEVGYGGANLPKN